MRNQRELKLYSPETRVLMRRRRRTPAPNSHGGARRCASRSSHGHGRPAHWAHLGTRAPWSGRQGSLAGRLDVADSLGAVAGLRQDRIGHGRTVRGARRRRRVVALLEWLWWFMSLRFLLALLAGYAIQRLLLPRHRWAFVPIAAAIMVALALAFPQCGPTRPWRGRCGSGPSSRRAR